MKEVRVAWMRYGPNWGLWFKRQDFLCLLTAQQWIDEYCRRHPTAEGVALPVGEHPMNQKATDECK